MEMENVTWCQESDSDDYYDYSDSEKDEPEGGLLVRWFNIFHHLITVAGMDMDEVWSIVKQVKTSRLWKDDADCVLDLWSWPTQRC